MMMRSRRFISVVLVGVLSCILLVGAAWGQAQPNPNGTTRPQAPPNGNGMMPQPMGPGPMMGGYQPSYYPELYDYESGYPAVEVRAVPAARVGAAVARAEFRHAQRTLDLLILEMRKAFHRSRDYMDALEAERESYEALEAAKRDALRSVMNDSAYQAAVGLRDSLTEQIEIRRSQRDATPRELLSMAQVKLSYAATASAMEAAALAADPDVQDARERHRRAHARLSELRQQFDTTVRTSEDVIAARQTVQDTRVSKLASEVYLTSVLEARQIALRYAYWSHRYDYYKYLSYGHYGYYRPYDYRRTVVGYPIGWSGYPY